MINTAATITDASIKQKKSDHYGRPPDTVLRCTLEIKQPSPVVPFTFDKWLETTTQSWGADTGQEDALYERLIAMIGDIDGLSWEDDPDDDPPDFEDCDATELISFLIWRRNHPKKKKVPATAFRNLKRDWYTSLKERHLDIADALDDLYQLHVTAVAESNKEILGQAGHLGILLMLINQQVNISISPIQQSFVQLLAPPSVEEAGIDQAPEPTA